MTFIDIFQKLMMTNTLNNKSGQLEGIKTFQRGQ